MLSVPFMFSTVLLGAAAALEDWNLQVQPFPDYNSDGSATTAGGMDMDMEPDVPGSEPDEPALLPRYVTGPNAYQTRQQMQEEEPAHFEPIMRRNLSTSSACACASAASPCTSSASSSRNCASASGSPTPTRTRGLDLISPSELRELGSGGTPGHHYSAPRFSRTGPRVGPTKRKMEAVWNDFYEVDGAEDPSDMANYDIEEGTEMVPPSLFCRLLQCATKRPRTSAATKMSLIEQGDTRNGDDYHYEQGQGERESAAARVLPDEGRGGSPGDASATSTTTTTLDLAAAVRRAEEFYAERDWSWTNRYQENVNPSTNRRGHGLLSSSSSSSRADSPSFVDRADCDRFGDLILSVLMAFTAEASHSEVELPEIASVYVRHCVEEGATVMPREDRGQPFASMKRSAVEAALPFLAAEANKRNRVELRSVAEDTTDSIRVRFIGATESDSIVKRFARAAPLGDLFATAATACEDHDITPDRVDLFLPVMLAGGQHQFVALRGSGNAAAGSDASGEGEDDPTSLQSSGLFPGDTTLHVRIMK